MNKERDRIIITEFLQWNDRNGSYNDKNCELEGIEPLTYEKALQYFFGVVNECYENIADNIFELTFDEVIKYAKENNFYDKTMEKLEHLIKHDNPTVEDYRKVIEANDFELKELKKENNQLKDRLVISPYGDDKIDELEQSIEHYKFQLESKTNELADLENKVGKLYKAVCNVYDTTDDYNTKELLDEFIGMF